MESVVRAAPLMPPWAMVVAERVGAIFVMTATFKPGVFDASKAARIPPPPLPIINTS